MRTEADGDAVHGLGVAVDAVGEAALLLVLEILAREVLHARLEAQVGHGAVLVRDENAMMQEQAESKVSESGSQSDSISTISAGRRQKSGCLLGSREHSVTVKLVDAMMSVSSRRERVLGQAVESWLARVTHLRT